MLAFRTLCTVHFRTNHKRITDDGDTGGTTEQQELLEILEKQQIQYLKSHPDDPSWGSLKIQFSRKADEREEDFKTRIKSCRKGWINKTRFARPL